MRYFVISLLLLIASLGAVWADGMAVPLTVAPIGSRGAALSYPPIAGGPAPSSPTVLMNTPTGASSGSPAGSTTGTATAGQVVFWFTNLSSTVNTNQGTCTDSAGNSYTNVQPAAAGGVINVALLWAVITHNIGTGVSLTCSNSANATWVAQGGWVIPNAVGIDKTATINQQTNSTSNTLTTGTLNFGNEVVVGYTFLNDTSATFTQPSGFTSLSTDSFSNVAYRVVSTTASIPFNDSWTVSTPYSCAVATFH